MQLKHLPKIVFLHTSYVEFLNVMEQSGEHLEDGLGQDCRCCMERELRKIELSIGSKESIPFSILLQTLAHRPGESL